MRLGIRISQNSLEKAHRDISKLTRKVIINKDGHKQTVYVKLVLPMKGEKVNDKRITETVNMDQNRIKKLEQLKKWAVNPPQNQEDLAVLHSYNTNPPKDETDEEKEIRYKVNEVLFDEIQAKTVKLQNKLTEGLQNKGYIVKPSNSNISESAYLYIKKNPNDLLGLKVRISEHNNRSGPNPDLDISSRDSYDDVIKRIEKLMEKG